MGVERNRLADDAGRGGDACSVASGRSTARGFSLLEMMLVIAIIALASVLAATALTGGLDGMRLRAAGKQVAAQLRYTRAQAIATGEPQTFTIDPHAHTWTSPKNHHGDLAKQLAITFIGAREVQPSAGEGAVMFFPDGASTGGRVRLQAGKATWDIDIAWLTGQVRLRRAQATR